MPFNNLFGLFSKTPQPKPTEITGLIKIYRFCFQERL